MMHIGCNFPMEINFPWKKFSDVVYNDPEDTDTQSDVENQLHVYGKDQKYIFPISVNTKHQHTSQLHEWEMYCIKIGQFFSLVQRKKLIAKKSSPPATASKPLMTNKAEAE